MEILLLFKRIKCTCEHDLDYTQSVDSTASFADLSCSTRNRAKPNGIDENFQNQIINQARCTLPG